MYAENQHRSFAMKVLSHNEYGDVVAVLMGKDEAGALVMCVPPS
jgi:hypothetical protein